MKMDNGFLEFAIGKVSICATAKTLLYTGNHCSILFASSVRDEVGIERGQGQALDRVAQTLPPAVLAPVPPAVLDQEFAPR